MTEDAKSGARHGVRRAAEIGFDVLMLGGAAYIVYRIARAFSWSELVGAFGRIPLWAVPLALVLTACDYAAMIGYDVVAFRFLGCDYERKRIILLSFITYAVKMNAPLPFLSGGGVRYKVYDTLGLSAADAAKVAAMNILTYALGLFAVAGVTLLLFPLPSPANLPVSVPPLRPVAIVLLALVAAYFALTRLGRRSFRVFGHEFTIPSTRTALEQLLVSCLDWLISPALLYVLLLGPTDLGVAWLLPAFLLAQLISLVIPVPGGLEAVLLLLRPPHTPLAGIVAALIVNRFIYYLLPLGIAAVLYIVHVARR